MPKRQHDSGPVKSKRPGQTEAAFHTAHSGRARPEASSRTPEASGHESIDSSFLPWHGQPASIRLHATSSSDTDATRRDVSVHRQILCIMAISPWLRPTVESLRRDGFSRWTRLQTPSSSGRARTAENSRGRWISIHLIPGPL